jgi:hypothetical protein
MARTADFNLGVTFSGLHSEHRRNSFTLLLLYFLFFTFQAKRPLRNPRPTYVDDIKMYFRMIGCIGMDWIDLVQDRDNYRALVSTVMSVLVE